MVYFTREPFARLGTCESTGWKHLVANLIFRGGNKMMAIVRTDARTNRMSGSRSGFRSGKLYVYETQSKPQDQLPFLIKLCSAPTQRAVQAEAPGL
jgi:hypothetical protein